jgi:hypothetical protein
MASSAMVLLMFVIQLVISAVIIYVVTKMFGEKEGFTTAILAALIGTVVYIAVSYLLPNMGWIAAVIAGIVWLLALQYMYKIGWLKSLVIAVVIWIVALIVGMFLPTLTGPL